MRELQRLLKDKDIEVRREAVESLRGKPGDLSVPLLLDAMQDASWRVRHSAIDVLLEEHPVDAYIEGLIRLLYRDENAGARNSAIEALVILNRKATPFLIQAFNTPNRDVRKFIIDVLGEFRDIRSLPLMLSALKDDDENVRVTAIEHIGKVGEASVVDALIEILESDDLWTAYPAVDALGRIGDRKSIPALIKALEKKPLRAPAVKSLGLIADPETIQHVIPFLEEPSKTVREEALLSIERFYHKGISEKRITEEIRSLIGERIFGILVSFAQSQKPAVKMAAILILGLLKDERSFAPLLEISQEADYAEDVKRALVFIGNDKPESLLNLFRTESLYQRRFICEVARRVASPVYYDIFISFLNDEDGHIRSLAAAALSGIGSPKAIEPIKRLLADPYEDVQEAAVQALSGFDRLLSIDELTGMLRDENPILRKNAALLLGKIGASEAIPALGFALKDSSVQVRKACIEAFSLLRTEDAVRFLVLALSDEQPSIRVSSALSLGEIGGKGVFEALSFLISDTDDAVRVAVSKAFGLLQDKRAVPLLISLLSDPNGFVVTTTIESLGHLSGEESGKALLSMLGNPDREIRRTAIKALSPFENIEENLLPFLKDSDWASRMAAVEVLGKNPQGKIRKELEKLLDTEEDPIVRKVVEDSLKKAGGHSKKHSRS